MKPRKARYQSHYLLHDGGVLFRTLHHTLPPHTKLLLLSLQLEGLLPFHRALPPRGSFPLHSVIAGQGRRFFLLPSRIRSQLERQRRRSYRGGNARFVVCTVQRLVCLREA